MPDNKYSEQELVQRFQAGEEDAFAIIYDAYHKKVLFFARRFVSDLNATDITADCFVGLWQRRENFPSLPAISSYLFITVRNRCYNLIAHEQVKEKHKGELINLMETETIPDSDLEDIRIQLIGLIRAELSRLPKKMRAVFILSFQEGLKPAEIAEQLNINVKTVSNQKATAIRLLRQALADHPLEFVLLLLLQLELTRTVVHDLC